MKSWLSQHRAAFALAFRRLWSTPLNTLLSLLVIGIALTLPAFGYVLLDNLRDVGSNASGVQQISIFMNLDASKKELGEIESRLKQAATGKWRFVPKDEALKRMQSSADMAEIVASLPRNPLPDAFIVEPTNGDPEALETKLLNAPAGATVNGVVYWDVYRALVTNVVLLNPATGTHLGQWNIWQPGVPLP